MAEAHDETIEEFCSAERISKSTYFKLRRMGLGPDELRFANTRIIRITPEAHVQWRARMQAWSASQAAALEARRRREQARAAGKLAAASFAHVSQRKSTGADLASPLNLRRRTTPRHAHEKAPSQRLATTRDG